MNKSLLLIFFSNLCCFLIHSQDVTVGLLSYNLNKSYEGYTMIYPHYQPSVFLLNNCGEVVHEWEDEENSRPGNSAYLLPDGNLIKTKRDAGANADEIWAGGGGETIEIRSWDNELLWSYSLNTADTRIHHDFEVLPNGNVLMLAWEQKTFDEAVAVGRNPDLLVDSLLWPDSIIEVDRNTNEIVWEWHAWDHLIQDTDASLPNYGVISEHPGRININFDTYAGGKDWMHTNAIDYNPTLDQILISIPHFNELWILDHSTTTEEAKTESGGNSNQGGNILYRVGNPKAYDRADAADKILFFQHDAHWAGEFLPDTDPNHGKIVCFNNQHPQGYSSVEIFDTSWNPSTESYDQSQGTYPPYTFENTILHPDTFSIFSPGLSSAQLLPNGNTLICSGRYGYTFELTPENEVVWEYITPRKWAAEVEQGTVLDPNVNLTFRAFRYPPEYEAFENKDLSPKSFIELNPIEDYCEKLTATTTPAEPISMIFPNPARDILHLSWDSDKKVAVKVYNLAGQLVLEQIGHGGILELDLSSLKPDLYLLTLDGKNSKRFIKL